MILQNKQTGVLGVLEATTYYGGRPDNIIAVYEMGMGAAKVLAQYNTLEELLEEWGDYEPKEPLIKDEKIRKAVRAWAEAECITKAYLENDYTMCRDDDVDVSISFCVPVFKDVGGTSDYTIAELCGEEEE